MFIGRKEELKTLKSLMDRRSAQFVTIKGRRRIGKSRLIEEFSKNFGKKYFFTGIPPVKGVTAQTQREEFIKQMVDQGFSNIRANDWSEIFFALSKFNSLTSVLSEIIGIIFPTPSSVAFCIIFSIGFFFTKQIARLILDELVGCLIFFKNFTSTLLFSR